MDDVVNRFAKELADAIAAAVAENPQVEACRARAREGAMDPHAGVAPGLPPPAFQPPPARTPSRGAAGRLAAPLRQQPHPVHLGRRAGLAAATETVPLANGVRFRVNGAAVGKGSRGHRLAMLSDTELAPRWRHPVHGNRSRWVTQLGMPWFFSSIRTEEPRYTRAAEAAIALDRRLGQLDHLAVPLIVLGQIHQCHGDPAKALDYYREALALAEDIGEPQLLFPCYDGLATLYLDQGNAAEAERHLIKAAEVSERAGLDRDSLVVLPFLC